MEISQAEKANQSQQIKKCIFCLQAFQKHIFGEHTKVCSQNYHKLVSQSQSLVQKQNTKILYKKCRYCSIQIETDQYQPHKIVCSSQSKTQTQKCPYCKRNIYQYKYQKHLEKCNASNNQAILKEEFVFPDYYKYKICYWCQEQIQIDYLQNHRYICRQKLRLEQDLSNYKLSPNQYNTLSKNYQKSAYQHLQAKNRVQPMIFSQGYTHQELLLMKQFIEHQAPLIIHTNLSKSIRHFVIDGEYKSLFQTNTSGGTSSRTNRRLWESYLFGKDYDNCPPNERIKYAVMNYANDKYGMMKCRKYGESIIVLKNSIRKRCTIAHNRKYAPGQIVATLKYPYSVLQKFRIGELKALSLASRGFQVESNDLQQFKQVHVHGPIRFSQDVQCIYTTKKQLQKLIFDVKVFQNKFGVKITAIEDLQKSQS